VTPLARRCALGGVTALIALLTVAAVAAPVSALAAAPKDARVSRILVLALPNVEWSDIEGAHLANLDRLFASSAIGGLVTNGVDRPSPLGSSYATLGAGTRATATMSTVGQGFDVAEEFGRDRAGVVFATRTGTHVGAGIVYMPINDVIVANESELYGAEVGRLGDELARAGIARGVIANGDGSDPGTPEDRVSPWRRSAVAALMTHDGRVPRGRVGRDLLQMDVTAPFGVRLDTTKVLAAFSAAWTDRSVVLVEGSDLVRAELAARFASDTQRERIRARALRATDRLVGRLLDQVDPARDAVIVVGPASPSERDSLTPVAVRAPGLAPGLLRSTTTLRDGFVNITDVAPTVLRLFGLSRPDAMEGRQMTTGAAGGSLDGRIGSLVAANDDGLFRDSQVGPSLTTVLIITCLLTVGGALAERFRRRGQIPLLPQILVGLALGLTGFLDATYLAGPFHFGRHGGAAPYWLFVSALAVLLASVFFVVARRKPVHALLVALGSLVVLHVADMVTGAHLEWNTAFGYSPTIGIRFVGEGNLTFAQVAAAAVLFAGLFVWQVPTRIATRSAVAVLAVTIVVMGVPAWGNDLGSVLAALPGFALLVWMLLGHEVRARTIAAVTGIVVATTAAVGLLDLLRPPDQRTHVGRFFEKVGTDFGGAVLVVRRKAAENLSVLGHSVLIGTIVAVALLVGVLWFVAPRRLRTVAAAVSTGKATVYAFLVVAVLGFGLNDSGIAVPGMMFAVFDSALVVLMASAAFERAPAEIDP
jgi:uncharacterized membrane protein (UPF0136 family)